MISNNPYQSPSGFSVVDPQLRQWIDGSEASLDISGLLHRRIVVRKPIEVTVEYWARGLRDRIIVDGRTAFSRVPIFSFYQTLEFEIPYCHGTLPAIVRLKTRSMTITRFELEIGGVVVYLEEAGQPVTTPNANPG